MNKETTKRAAGRNGILVLSAAALLMLCLSAGTVQADGPVVVIVNADNPVQSLTPDEIREFYHNEKLTWANGKKVTLYDLMVKDAARGKFSLVILKQEPERVAMEWANKKITNSAKNPPRTVTSAILMQSRVAKDRTAIGYLFKSDLTNGGVKIVATIE